MCIKQMNNRNKQNEVKNIYRNKQKQTKKKRANIKASKSKVKNHFKKSLGTLYTVLASDNM